MRVTRNGLHVSQLLCTARELYFVSYIFVCCTRVILNVLHDSKKHMSQFFCVLHAS